MIYRGFTIWDVNHLNTQITHTFAQKHLCVLFITTFGSFDFVQKCCFCGFHGVGVPYCLPAWIFGKKYPPTKVTQHYHQLTTNYPIRHPIFYFSPYPKHMFVQHPANYHGLISVVPSPNQMFGFGF